MRVDLTGRLGTGAALAAGSLLLGCGGPASSDGSVEAPLVSTSLKLPSLRNAVRLPYFLNCLPYQVDLGSTVEATGLLHGHGFLFSDDSGCDPWAPMASFRWEAPSDGTWVIDTYGSEGAFLSAVIKDRCVSDQHITCGAPMKETTVTVQRGDQLLIVAAAPWGEHFGPGNLLVNIRPLLAQEQGPDCFDGADNDANGLADCDDPLCAARSECLSTACAQETLPSVLPVEVFGELTVADHRNRFHLCPGDLTREHVFAWQAPLTGRVVVDASRSAFGAQVSVREGSCIGREVGACPADDLLPSTAVNVQEGQWYFVMIVGISHKLAFGADGRRILYMIRIFEAEEELLGRRCFDDTDNDGDGLIDGADPECVW